MRHFAIFLLGLLAVLYATEALCWEFSMSGEYENRIRWFSRTGPKDLFGYATIQDEVTGGVLVGLAGPNILNTGALPTVPSPTSNFFFNLGSTSGRQLLITRGGFSSAGSDSTNNDTRLTLTGAIRVNKAVRIRGVVNIGGYRNKYSQNAAQGATGQGIPPLERYFVSQASVNAYDTLSLVSVEQFWATLQLPFGILAIGPRAFPFGTGATFGRNTRSEMYLLAVPYGPFRFLFGLWPASMRIPSNWAITPDSAVKSTSHQALFMTYDASSLRMGAASILRQYHGDNTVPYLRNVDDTTWLNLAFLKYWDGRFFANVEYAWANIDRARLVNLGQDGVIRETLSQTMAVEANHFFAEGGLTAGPLKLSLMFGLASGPVLNNGNRLRNVPAGGFFLSAATPAPFEPGPNPKVYVPWAINYQALEPYEFLMFNTYAGGNNGGWNALDFTYVADDHGMMTDGYCLAGRIDYSLAANLNLWGSYIWAHRLERAGTYFGQFQSSGSLAAGSIPNLKAFYADAGRSWGTGNDYVSDGFIGWEVNLGVDWELLESVAFRCRYSFLAAGRVFQGDLSVCRCRSGRGCGHGRSAVVPRCHSRITDNYPHSILISGPFQACAIARDGAPGTCRKIRTG